MVKVYKDILKYLQIDNLFITGNKNAFCNLIEIDSREWIVAIDRDIYDSKAILNIKLNDDYIEVPIILEKKDQAIYSLKLRKNVSDKRFDDLQSRIKKLEENYKQWEKRKEERYCIGEKNVERFLLYCETQTLIKNKLQLPCYLNNISFNGANITTIITDISGKKDYHIGDEVYLILNFKEPIEQIYLKAYIQSIALKSAKNSTNFKFAILSLKLIEPSLSYKSRLGNYVKTLGE